MVIGERDNFRFAAGFAANQQHAQTFVAHMGAQRFQLGLAALPPPEDLINYDAMELHARIAAEQIALAQTAPQAAPPPGDTIVMPDPTQQIERLASLRDRGLISDDEYQAKKTELLDRI